MTSLILSAPGGATVLGSETAGPPGWACGAGGWVNRSRSRPGCALGGITCAIAAVETIAIASAAAMRPNPANIPRTPYPDRRRDLSAARRADDRLCEVGKAPAPRSHAGAVPVDGQRARAGRGHRPRAAAYRRGEAPDGGPRGGHRYLEHQRLVRQCARAHAGKHRDGGRERQGRAA